MLRLEDVSIRFGGLKAVTDVSFEVAKGAIHSVIGPNGAGKTTLFNAITGVVPIGSGAIILDDERIDGLAPHMICRKGIARTFQNLRLFATLSVLDNVLIADEARPGAVAGFLPTLLCLPFARKAEIAAKERAMDLLQAVGLADKASRIANTLSYGDQRRLEIARALATMPKLLLLDEPAAGMNPKETGSLIEFIASLPDKFAVTILIIEHQMRLVMRVSQQISVLEYGRNIFTGAPDLVRRHPEVLRAYLGGRTAERALREYQAT
jgi:branched-chain amino acid transport system ATP-binding protein